MKPKKRFIDALWPVCCKVSGCGDINTAVILAGGGNTRFGSLKSFIDIEGVPIIARNLTLLRKLFKKIFISTNDPEPYFGLAECAGITLVGDVLPSLGPMSGIHAALLNTDDQGVFATGCDMPFLNEKMIRLVRDSHMRRCRGLGPCDATVPVHNDKPQPLFAVYSRTLLPAIESAVSDNRTSLARLLENANTFFIVAADINAIDPEGRSFMNINTAEDHEALKRVV